MFCDVMIIVFFKKKTTLRDRYVLSHFSSRKRLGCRVCIRIRGTKRITTPPGEFMYPESRIYLSI